MCTLNKRTWHLCALLFVPPARTSVNRMKRVKDADDECHMDTGGQR